MPRPPKQTDKAPEQAAQPLPTGRPVIYPELTVNGIPIPVEKMKLTAATMQKLLAWETEAEYKVRMEKSNDVHERARGLNGYGDEYLLVDEDGHKVRCHNNLDNRPYDDPTSQKYTQDILNRVWAGPSTFPGETVNGETMIIGRTGKVESGQHTGIALVRAAQKWRKNPKAYPQWTEEPFIERLVVFGVSENPVIVRTLDNVRPRTLADTVYTSEVFKFSKDGKETSQKDRKELSRMLDAAVDFLWKRTDAGGDNEPARRYQTHAASFDFLGRHDRLKKCVKHLFECNTNRQISLLHMSPGACAAAMYMMASCSTDIDEYLKSRSEKHLKWDFWDKAEEFFVLLADGNDKSFKVLVNAIGELYSPTRKVPGLGGTTVEKMCVLALGWRTFLKGETITPEDLALAYGVDGNQNPVILDPPGFGGIDCGPNPTPPEKVTPQQAEKNKEEARKKKAEDALKVVGQGKGYQKGSAGEVLESLKKEHPDSVLLFRSDAGDYNVYADDAKVLSEKLATDLREGPGKVPLVTIPAVHFEVTVRQLLEGGVKLKTIAFTNGEPTVTEVRPRAKPLQLGKEPAPATNATPNGKQETPAPAGKKKEKGKKAPTLKGGTNS